MNETQCKLDKDIVKIETILEYSRRIEDKLEDMETKLSLLEKKLDGFEIKLDKILSSSSNMDNHINFIDSVYDNVKYPLNFMVNKVNTIANYTTTHMIEK